jgi:hypothetical protein
MDAVDPVRQQGFWITEIESFYELVSEQLLGLENSVSDQDESDMETVSSVPIILLADIAAHRMLSPEFKPILVATLEATLESNNLYSDISGTILTPPPRKG